MKFSSKYIGPIALCLGVVWAGAITVDSTAAHLGATARIGQAHDAYQRITEATMAGFSGQVAVVVLDKSITGGSTDILVGAIPMPKADGAQSFDCAKAAQNYKAGAFVKVTCYSPREAAGIADSAFTQEYRAMTSDRWVDHFSLPTLRHGRETISKVDAWNAAATRSKA